MSTRVFLSLTAPPSATLAFGLSATNRVICRTFATQFLLNENFALAKYFPLGEKVKLKLEIEYFNAFNRVIFGSPDTSLQDSNFGKVINSQANAPRQGQAHFEIKW